MPELFIILFIAYVFKSIFSAYPIANYDFIMITVAFIIMQILLNIFIYKELNLNIKDKKYIRTKTQEFFNKVFLFFDKKYLWLIPFVLIILLISSIFLLEISLEVFLITFLVVVSILIIIQILKFIRVYLYNSFYPLRNILYILFMFYIAIMFVYTILNDLKESKIKIFSGIDIPIYIYKYDLAHKYSEISNFLKPITIKHDEDSKKVLFAGETDRFIYYYDISDLNLLIEDGNYSEKTICQLIDRNSTAIIKNDLIKFHESKDINLTKLKNFRNSCKIIQKEGTKILGFCMGENNNTKCNSYIFEGVKFDFNSAKLKEDTLKSIEDFAKFLIENEKYKAEIRGHTDNIGDDEYNKKLSEERAKAVYEKLINYGVAKDRLSYKGCGERCPLVDNDREENMAKNRRVEAKF